MRTYEELCHAPRNSVMRARVDRTANGIKIILSMAIPASEGWLELVSQRQASFDKRSIKHDFDKQIYWVEEIERAAKKRKEKHIQRDLSRLTNSNKRIRRFAETISKRSDEVSAGELMRMVWGIQFAVIKLGFSSSLTFEAILRPIEYLDARLPSLPSSTETTADFPALHNPLKSIYSRYLDAFERMLTVIDESPNYELEDIEPFLIESADLFQSQIAEYQKLRELAGQVVEWASQPRRVNPNFDTTTDEELGRGTFGRVYRVEEQSTGHVYALKKIPIGRGLSQASSSEKVEDEINIMRKLSHHHITTLSFAIKDEDTCKLYISPVAECSLHEYLSTPDMRTKYTDRQIYKWFGCLVGALDYAHRNGIKHKDVKPANILLNEDGDRVLLTDFGLAKDFSKLNTNSSTGPLIYGTPKYLAPECEATAERTELVDTFALGCVFAEILRYLKEKQMIREFDKEREKWGGVEFRNSYGKTRDWLDSICKVVSNSSSQHLKLVASQARKMLIKHVSDRATTADVLEKFHTIRCSRCPR